MSFRVKYRRVPPRSFTVGLRVVLLNGLIVRRPVGRRMLTRNCAWCSWVLAGPSRVFDFLRVAVCTRLIAERVVALVFTTACTIASIAFPANFGHVVETARSALTRVHRAIFPNIAMAGGAAVATSR